MVFTDLDDFTWKSGEKQSHRLPQAALATTRAATSNLSARHKYYQCLVPFNFDQRMIPLSRSSPSPPRPSPCSPRPLKGKIRHLVLCGNPVGLLPFYRERVLGACGQQLLVLDDLRIGIDERADGVENVELLHELECVEDDSASRGTQEGNRGGYGGALNMVHFSVKAS